jgi:hypothetical protein
MIESKLKILGKSTHNFPQKFKHGDRNDLNQRFVQYHKNGSQYWVSEKHWQKITKRKRENSKKHYYSNPQVKEKKLQYAKSDKAFDARLRRDFGIGVEDYNTMFRNQNGVCAICKLSCSTGKRLSVDHCHDTGKVRGLLCTNCNNGIGHLMDSIELLAEAIRYLS